MGSRRKRKSIEPAQAANAEAARAAAVALLARQDFASGELRMRLEQQGFRAQAVTEALAGLLQGRLLDDGRYAENYVSYHAARGQGPLRIATDLRAVGVAENLIEAALGGPDWRALASQVRSRKFGPAAPSSWPDKARQARFLQYRGFSSDHIRLALGGDLDPD